MYDDEDPVVDDGPVDILYLLDRLEELVRLGKRVPFSNRVMVEEVDFLTLVDSMRQAVPDEVRQAQRVIKDRAKIIAEAHEEAAKIQDAARQRAEYYLSREGIVNEAKQHAEHILRLAEEQRKEILGEIDAYAIEQFSRVEEALRDGLSVIDQAVRETAESLADARGAIGR